MGTHTLIDTRHDIEHHDVEAVNARTAKSQYASRQKIYPKRGSGFYRNVKWAVMVVTHGHLLSAALDALGPRARGSRIRPSSSIWPTSAFTSSGSRFWPQELYLVTGLLVAGGAGAVLVHRHRRARLVRIPVRQTVWTDLMVAVERFWQGDRNARIRLDKEPWGRRKIFKKVDDARCPGC